MRALMAIAALTGIIAAHTASAADLSRGDFYDDSYSVRAPQLLVYDVEPGTNIRAYWAPPWQNRRYFPFTGKKPKAGRLEDLNAPRRVAAPAPSYYREWSTLSLYPPRAALPPADLPRRQPLPQQFPPPVNQ